MDDKTVFILQVIMKWRNAGSFVKKANDYNYYLSCGNYDDRNHHIHIIFTDNSDAHRYTYKRNGWQDNADGAGYAFFSDNLNYCMEKGHPPEWNENRWVNFLYKRLCEQREKWGSCE